MRPAGQGRGGGDCQCRAMLVKRAATAASTAAVSASSCAQAAYPSGRTRTVVRRSPAQCSTAGRVPGSSSGSALRGSWTVAGVMRTKRPPWSASYRRRPPHEGDVRDAGAGEPVGAAWGGIAETDAGDLGEGLGPGGRRGVDEGGHGGAEGTHGGVVCAGEAHEAAAAAQNRLADRMPFALVGVEQTVGGLSLDDGGEFPAEVGGVLEAGVHALPMRRGVDVGGVMRRGRRGRPGTGAPAVRRCGNGRASGRRASRSRCPGRGG